MKTIVIIGAGMMGSAMSYPATINGNEVRLVGTPLDDDIIRHAIETGYHKTLKRELPEGVKCYQFEDVLEALPDADILVSGVSSFGVDWFFEHVLPIIPDSLPILSVTKGMINTPEGSFISFPQYYQNKLPRRKLSFNAIGGPCISFELADDIPTTVCFCGEDIDMLRDLKNVFETPHYRISLSTDVTGVECAVALKNVYALGVSLAVGLSERQEGIGGREYYNPQAALFGQSIKEMTKFLSLVGGLGENIFLGAGDLYVTVFGGRSRLIGTLVGRGLAFDDAMKELKGQTLESVVIAKWAAKFLQPLIENGTVKVKDFPLLLHINDIISNNQKQRKQRDGSFASLLSLLS